MTVSKISRFGEWDLERQLFRVGGLTKSQTFFAGPEADERMADVRRAISDIRVNWHLYPQFMEELRQFLRDSVPEPSYTADKTAWADGRARMEALLSSEKKWSDGDEGSTENDYSAVRFYTSIYGYIRMFKAINLAFRAKDLTDYPLALRSATFLVELLNIDLYNYRGSHPDADNFEGHVYRGMRVTSEELSKYGRTAVAPDIAKRFVSVPLSMMSTSTDRSWALQFARPQPDQPSGRHPVLWDITVFSVDSALLAAYWAAFPASIVTSMCAVPIQQISDIPDEREVLLRGPLFQLIRVYRDEDNLKGEPLNVVEAIMLNSNRDHISAIATNTGEDLRARKLFRDMIIAHRSALCAERAAAIGLPADAEAYHSAGARARDEFEASALG